MSHAQRIRDDSLRSSQLPATAATDYQLSKDYAGAELERFRQRSAADGRPFDCFRVAVSLPDEGPFDGYTTCVHERVVIGPIGSVERFAAALDELVARFAREAAEVSSERSERPASRSPLGRDWSTSRSAAS